MSSPAIVARASEPVSSVARLMLESGINGVPVLDAGERPVGMVSDGDLLGHRGEARRASWLEMLSTQSPFAGFPKNALERPVSEVMSAPLIPARRPALSRSRKTRRLRLFVPDDACQPGKSLPPLLKRLGKSIGFHVLERICSCGRKRQNRVIVFPVEPINRSEHRGEREAENRLHGSGGESVIVKNI